MNDRYLYRAKRTDNGEWITGYLLVKKKDFYICEKPYECMDEYSSLNGQSYGFGDFKFVDPSTICQCTGLKDKNGKLIWENDIVHNGNYFVVKWNLSCTRFDFALNNSHNIPVGRWEPMIIDWKNSDFKEYRNNIDFEVIGNIFDNPELLEVGE